MAPAKRDGTRHGWFALPLAQAGRMGQRIRLGQLGAKLQKSRQRLVSTLRVRHAVLTRPSIAERSSEAVGADL